MQNTPNPQPTTRGGGNDDGSKPMGYRKLGDAKKKDEQS